MNKLKQQNILITLGLLINLCASCEMLFKEEPQNNAIALFENFWESFDDDYALFEERGIDWDETYSKFRPIVEQNTTQSELYHLFTKMIAPIEDGHVALMAPHFGAFDANKYFRERIEDELFDLSVVQGNYLERKGCVVDKKFTYGKIKDANIAYIHFDVFRAESVKLNEMLTAFPEVNGCIVDLRHNNGGDVSFSFSFLGRFALEDKLFLRSKTKNGKGPNDYTPWYSWYLKKHGPFIDKPLIILTDRYTVSAAERMVMAAKTLPNVLIVGDTTNGTFGTKISRELANGWFFSYSIQKVEMYDGKSYEGIGLAPDIWVKNDEVEISKGIDRTLQVAIDRLK